MGTLVRRFFQKVSFQVGVFIDAKADVTPGPEGKRHSPAVLTVSKGRMNLSPIARSRNVMVEKTAQLLKQQSECDAMPSADALRLLMSHGHSSYWLLSQLVIGLANQTAQ